MMQFSVIRNWCIGIVVLFILVAGNVSAQNVSITDYQVPVSSADRFLIDFSANHAITMFFTISESLSPISPLKFSISSTGI